MLHIPTVGINVFCKLKFECKSNVSNDAKAVLLGVENVMRNGIATILMRLFFGGILNQKGRKTDLRKGLPSL